MRNVFNFEYEYSEKVFKILYLQINCHLNYVPIRVLEMCWNTFTKVLYKAARRTRQI